MLIFIFQSIWLFIDELAGKDLDFQIIGKFLFYYAPTMMDKVLPFTILLSGIVTYGNLAEHNEFAAMKASGISLQKAMRSNIYFVSLVGIMTFFLANNVIPAAEQKIFNLRKNIARVKPSAAINEGVFTDIEGSAMNIKVEEKYGENDRYLRDVIIHQKSESDINTTVIRAEQGEFISTKGSDILQLVLYNGDYYEEIIPKKGKEKQKQPFASANFKTYIKNIDLSTLNDMDLERENNITTDKMKNISRLIKDIDSLKTFNLEQVDAFSNNIINRLGAFPVVLKEELIQTIKEKPDSLKAIVEKTTPVIKSRTTPQGQLIAQRINMIQQDSVLFAKNNPEDEVLKIIPSWQRTQVVLAAKNDLLGIKNSVAQKTYEIKRRFEFYNRHIISLHKKFALALSCIILFFIAAPLGAIVRKGGLGLPVVLGVLLFITYHFLGVFAENYAKQGNISPVLGAWLSTLVTFPLSIFLTSRATADRGLVNFGESLINLKDAFKFKLKKEIED